MLLSADDPTYHNYKVFDCCGQEIHYAKQYDTDTREITIYLKNKDEKFIREAELGGMFRPKAITFVLRGSYAVDPQGNRIF
jgi:hypothetical protein